MPYHTVEKEGKKKNRNEKQKKDGTHEIVRPEESRGSNWEGSRERKKKIWSQSKRRFLFCFLFFVGFASY